MSIVDTALSRGLQMIGISDHNTAENVHAVMKVGERKGLLVIPAMEVSSIEEAHIICLFPNLDSALDVQNLIYTHLNKSPEASFTQDQVLASENDEVEGFCPYLLISSSQLSIRRIVERVHELDGLAIAAHVDRPSFSVISQLGFIPPQIQFDALEVSANLSLRDAPARFPEYSSRVFITNSDAHYLHDIGRVFSRYEMNSLCFSCIRDALHSRNSCGILPA